jgi:AcrR family transcriptional regulator
MSKKQLIMEKAIELFAKNGFESTSVQQITEHCGISKGAFYLSFKSKDELIVALIDHFMIQFTSDIDYLVKNTLTDELLHQFYMATFQSFHKHSDFAKILMKEQTQSFNQELILKMRYYDRLFEDTILYMVDRIYMENANNIKYDLMYCIKGFISMYSHLFIFYQLPLDLKLLSESLVEKTDILAQHTTIPFISQDLIHLLDHSVKEEFTKEKVLALLDDKIEEMDDSIEKESLTLLKQDLLEPSFNPAIVKGLIENIRKHPSCKWISYLLLHYFNF